MPLTTPALSTDAPAAAPSGLPGDAAAVLGVSALSCEWIGVTTVLWAVGVPSTARDGCGPFGRGALRVGSLWRSPVLGRRKLATRRTPVRTPAAPLPFTLPGGCPLVSTFASGTAATAIVGTGGGTLSPPGAAAGDLSANMSRAPG